MDQMTDCQEAPLCRRSFCPIMESSFPHMISCSEEEVIVMMVKERSMEQASSCFMTPKSNRIKSRLSPPPLRKRKEDLQDSFFKSQDAIEYPKFFPIQDLDEPSRGPRKKSLKLRLRQRLIHPSSNEDEESESALSSAVGLAGTPPL